MKLQKKNTVAQNSENVVLYGGEYGNSSCTNYTTYC